MLSAEKNERLTRVGPGTPMGELLRRYRDKFGSAVAFRQLWTRESSIRYSPVRDDVFALFGDPVPAWT